MKIKRTLIGALGALALGMGTVANAAEYEFNLQSFLPAQATIPSKIIDVWADKIEEDSGGRIEITRYPSMQLGGKPPELLDQVIDGVIDMTWNVIGYTPGRFPSTEVFELPFLVNDAKPASAAFWTLLEEDIAAREFSDVKVLGGWVHGPGMIHANKEVLTPDDFNGMKIRGASRQVNALLSTLGATPVGMPVPAVPEALSKGVIDGTTIPWEVTKALKVPELVENHTEFTGPMMYTVTFVLAMNKEKFAALPDDLKAVIDDNSGLEFSMFAGEVQQAYDEPAREIALDRGNNVVTLDAEQSAAWAEAAQPVYDTWLSEMNEKGIDGQALIDRAKALMNEYGS
ncbi:MULTISPECIES: TRAP transporter substrate-binding protein [unclassified Ruegeria]|uniref:TRAP transporter substrate-binding protein n=1 Tax=unclassified Ruegeria TaxID=2625375 RepID=UPI001ADA9DEF|nr:MULTISPECIES: TRAP transporter substrate-binding protein [unclassified Ruegeria]MBO9412628.1 TRAP transporter substrate-binding protein [Ruegeria sp. R8_1]MBO9416134.1 TRAP transporter substrate-binding protein [Ruegeria sp. R8_2]